MYPISIWILNIVTYCYNIADKYRLIMFITILFGSVNIVTMKTAFWKIKKWKF